MWSGFLLNYLDAWMFIYQLSGKINEMLVLLFNMRCKHYDYNETTALILWVRKIQNTTSF